MRDLGALPFVNRITPQTNGRGSDLAIFAGIWTQSSPHADAVLADERRRHHGRLLVLAGALPACRTTDDVDLRALDWHLGAAVTALTPRAVMPILPAERAVSQTSLPVQSSVAEEYYAERSGNRWVSV